MEISALTGEAIRIRSKLGSFVIDPVDGMPKISADGVVLQNPSSKKGLSRVTDQRIVINGPGDYEVSGIKVVAVKGKSGLLCHLIVDGVDVFLGKASEISQDEKGNACDVLLLNVDSAFSESLISAADPKVVLLYGANQKEALKLLGKETLVPVKKFAVALEKLPAEMEVAGLG